MFKITIPLALLITVLCPLAGRACPQSNNPQQVLNQDYPGITAFNAAAYLGIDDACSGRRLYNIILSASSSGGPGLATLIVNGVPVGNSQQVGPQSAVYTFQFDPVFNYVGTDINTFEIRLSGDFHIDYVSATMSDPMDYWETQGFLVGKTALATADTTTTSTLNITSDMYPIARFLFVARQGEFNLNAVVLHFDDGTEQAYGSAIIPNGSAVRIDLADSPLVTSVVVIGNAASPNTSAQIEVRALHQVDSNEANARAVR